MTDNQHILRAFDEDLEKIQAKIVKMGGLVEAAMNDAATAFNTHDVALAEKLRDADKIIDQLECDIRDDAVQIIALRSPRAVDLRIILCAMKVASNFERIADYAKNIAKRTIVLAQMPSNFDNAGSLRRINRAVVLMLNDALEAFINRDAEMARAVIARDVEVDQMYNALFREFLTFMMEDPRNITICMHLHFMAKNIERMGDHITTICEQVVYLVEGAYPEDDRQKGDITSVKPIDLT